MLVSNKIWHNKKTKAIGYSNEWSSKDTNAHTIDNAMIRCDATVRQDLCLGCSTAWLNWIRNKLVIDDVNIIMIQEIQHEQDLNLEHMLQFMKISSIIRRCVAVLHICFVYLHNPSINYNDGAKVSAGGDKGLLGVRLVSVGYCDIVFVCYLRIYFAMQYPKGIKARDARRFITMCRRLELSLRNAAIEHVSLCLYPW